MSRASSPPPQRPAPHLRPVASARPGDVALQSLLNTISTLELAVEEETAALNAKSHVDLDAFSYRKSQGLIELNRAMKQLGILPDHVVVTQRLGSLREKLAVNQQTLKFHLEAVREVSTIIANAIRESESDGTYSESIRSPQMSYGYD